jgi:hypothetical protein
LEEVAKLAGKDEKKDAPKKKTGAAGSSKKKKGNKGQGTPHVVLNALPNAEVHV